MSDARFLLRIVLILVAALMMVPTGSAWADETGAGEVAGSYRIQIQSGGDYPDCSTVHVGDVVAISPTHRQTHCDLRHGADLGRPGRRADREVRRNRNAHRLI